MNQIHLDIIEWAEQKGIFQNSDIKSQCLKFMAEAGETADEINKGTDRLKTMEEIGDVIVTLVLLTTMLNTNIDLCAELALSKIQKRTGRMENGVFIKDGK